MQSNSNPGRLLARISMGAEPRMDFFDRDEKGAGPILEVTTRLDAETLVDLVVLPGQLGALRHAALSGVPALLVAIVEEAIASLMAGARTLNSRRRAEA